MRENTGAFGRAVALSFAAAAACDAGCGGRSGLDLVDDTGGGAAGSSAGSTPVLPATSCSAAGPDLSNCGSASESCCASPQVAGGTFYRTYRNSGSGPTGEADPATVSRFRLDTYMVTVGRFRKFVSAWNGGSGWLPAAGTGKHVHLLQSCTDDGESLSTWTNSPQGNENLPINCVTWAESYAFCIWDGGFLPSSAEWEYAAAGGSQQRQYPWGITPPGPDNQYAIYGCNFSSGPDACDPNAPGTADIAPVGTAAQGAGAWGQLDLAGNIWELTLDWGRAPTYRDPCSDCADLSDPQLSGIPSSRVWRGGDFAFDGSDLFPWYLYGGDPTVRQVGYVGFRCARSP